MALNLHFKQPKLSHQQTLTKMRQKSDPFSEIKVFRNVRHKTPDIRFKNISMSDQKTLNIATNTSFDQPEIQQPLIELRPLRVRKTSKLLRKLTISLQKEDQATSNHILSS